MVLAFAVRLFWLVLLIMEDLFFPRPLGKQSVIDGATVACESKEEIFIYTITTVYDFFHCSMYISTNTSGK